MKFSFRHLFSSNLLSRIGNAWRRVWGRLRSGEASANTRLTISNPEALLNSEPVSATGGSDIEPDDSTRAIGNNSDTSITPTLSSDPKTKTPISGVEELANARIQSVRKRLDFEDEIGKSVALAVKKANQILLGEDALARKAALQVQDEVVSLFAEAADDLEVRQEVRQNEHASEMVERAVLAAEFAARSAQASANHDQENIQNARRSALSASRAAALKAAEEELKLFENFEKETELIRLERAQKNRINKMRLAQTKRVEAYSTESQRLFDEQKKSDMRNGGLGGQKKCWSYLAQIPPSPSALSSLKYRRHIVAGFAESADKIMHEVKKCDVRIDEPEASSAWIARRIHREVVSWGDEKEELHRERAVLVSGRAQHQWILDIERFSHQLNGRSQQQKSFCERRRNLSHELAKRLHHSLGVWLRGDHHLTLEQAEKGMQTDQQGAPESTPVDMRPADYVPGAESKNELHQVQVDSFEGPLDLLLFLIRKHKIDIFDIPIAFICERYLEMMKAVEDLNIDAAAEFMFMASELLHLKSKLLLPKPTEVDDDEEDEDPRAELVLRLLEYQKYKTAASDLDESEWLGRDVYLRPAEAIDKPRSDNPLKEVGVFALIESFDAVLKRQKPEIRHQVVMEQVSLSQRIRTLSESLIGGSALPFTDLVADIRGKVDLVVTFLAILEMTKWQLLSIYQSETGQIYIQAKYSEVEHALRVMGAFDESEYAG